MKVTFIDLAVSDQYRRSLPPIGDSDEGNLHRSRSVGSVQKVTFHKAKAQVKVTFIDLVGSPAGQNCGDGFEEDFQVEEKRLVFRVV